MPTLARKRTVNRDRALRFKTRDTTRPAIERLGSARRQTAIQRLQHLYGRRGDVALDANTVRDNVFAVESPGEYDAVFWRDDGGRRVHVRVAAEGMESQPKITDLKRHLLADLEDTASLGISPVEPQREAMNTVVIEGDAALDFDAIAKDLIDGFNSDNRTRQLVVLRGERVKTGDSTVAVFFQLHPAFVQMKGDLVVASRGRKTNQGYQNVLRSLDELIRLEGAPLPAGDDRTQRARRLAEEIKEIREIERSLEAAKSTSRFDKDQRNAALDRFAGRLSEKRRSLEYQLRDTAIAYQAGSSEGRPKAFAKLLKENRDIRAALLPDPELLRPVVAELPLTEESHAAIEELENHLIRQAPNETVNGKVRVRADLLTTKAHEVFFRKKTEILEHVIEGVIRTAGQPGLVALRRFGRANLWKILIDGKVHAADDKHAYDRSKGYMASMMKGLLRIVRQVETALSTDFVLRLHQDATALVTTEGRAKDDVPLLENSFQEQGLKKAKNSWGVTGGFEAQGLQEIELLLTELDGRVSAKWDEVISAELKEALRARFNDGLSPNTMRVGAYFEEVLGSVENSNGVPIPTFEAGWAAQSFKDGRFTETVGALMDHVIAKAHREIDGANGNQDRVLGAIVDCCRGLGVIHPFKDANGRVMMFLVLNKLLMENGMPPTILQDQGYMVGKSKATLIGLIKQGQAIVAPPGAAPPGGIDLIGTR